MSNPLPPLPLDMKLPSNPGNGPKFSDFCIIYA